MDPLVLVGVPLMAFACEYIDSSLGMGYGTILSPLLIILGLDPLVVVPSVLVSQGFAGLVAAASHARFGNMELNGRSRDLQIALMITAAGLLACFAGVWLSLRIPTVVLKTYIGALVITMGVVILTCRPLSFSWGRIAGVGTLSAFNKALSGGGFGPVVTCGQMLSGVEGRAAIAVTTLTEVPICMAGFTLYLLMNGGVEPALPVLLTVGAVLVTPLGARNTSRRDPGRTIRIVGLLTVALGTLTLVKTFLA